MTTIPDAQAQVLSPTLASVVGQLNGSSCGMGEERKNVLTPFSINGLIQV